MTLKYLGLKRRLNKKLGGALRDMVVKEVNIGGRDCYLKHRLSEIQKLIMRKLKAKVPQNLTPIEDFSI